MGLRCSFFPNQVIFSNDCALVDSSNPLTSMSTGEGWLWETSGPNCSDPSAMSRCWKTSVLTGPWVAWVAVVRLHGGAPTTSGCHLEMIPVSQGYTQFHKPILRALGMVGKAYFLWIPHDYLVNWMVSIRFPCPSRNTAATDKLWPAKLTASPAQTFASSLRFRGCSND